MRLKSTLAIVAMIAMMATAGAKTTFGLPGCGLGTIMFEGKKGLMFNVLAGTFNGSSGNQTFGMSTGTLGCEDAKSATVSSVAFIEGNYVALSNDVSRGGGDALETYLEIIGKKGASTQELRANFASIFAPGQSPNKIDQNLKAYL